MPDFIERIKEADGLRIRINPHLGQQFALDSLARIVVMCAGSKGGKCDNILTYINMSDGTRKRLGDVRPGDVVLSLDDRTQKVVPAKVTGYIDAGPQECFRVRTWSGRELEVSATHPLRGPDGWRPLSEFRPEDWIAIPRTLPCEGEETWSEEKCRLIGYLIGDGGLSQTTPCFTKADADVLADFTRCVPSDCEVIQRQERITYGIRGRSDADGNSVTRLVRDLKINCLSKHKKMPDEVFRLTNPCVAQLLAALFACDGWVDAKGVGYCSASKELLYAVQHLLLRFGIRGRTREKKPKCNGKTFEAWGIDIVDLDDVERYAEKIGFSAGPKTARLLALLQKKRQRGHASYHDRVPDFVKPPAPRGDPEGYALFRACRFGTITRTFAAKMSTHFGGQEEKVNSDIFWDKIRDITSVGVVPTADLEVAGTENYVAADFFAHNTCLAPVWLDGEIRRLGANRDYYCVAGSHEMLKLKFLPALREYFEEIRPIARYWAQDKTFELADTSKAVDDPRRWWAKGPSDRMFGRIIVRSAESPSSLESGDAAAAIADEAGDWPWASWEALQRRLALAIGYGGGRTLVPSTPYRINYFVTEIVNKAGRIIAIDEKERVSYIVNPKGEPDVEVIQFGSVLNPTFPKSEDERDKRLMPPWRYEMFRRGRIVKPAGVVYDCFDVATHVRESSPFAGCHWVCGVDFGLQTTSAHAGLWNPQTDLLHVLHEYYQGHRSSSEHARSIMYLNGNHPYLGVYGGSAGEEQFRTDFTIGGLSIREPKVTSVDVRHQMMYGRLRAGTLIFHPRCINLIDQYQTMSYDLAEDGRTVLPKIKNKGAWHACDSVAYVATSLRPRAMAGVLDMDKAIKAAPKERDNFDESDLAADLNWKSLIV